MKFYILNGRNIVPTEDIREIEKMLVNNNNCVAKHVIGEVTISTAFLGIDHGFSEKAEPVLFETMIFGGRYDQDTVRSCTYEQAEWMHLLALSKIINILVKRNRFVVYGNCIIAALLLIVAAYCLLTVEFYGDYLPMITPLLVLSWWLIKLTENHNTKLGEAIDMYDSHFAAIKKTMQI